MIKTVVAYELTVNSAIAAIIESMGSNGEPVYEKKSGGSDALIRAMDIIKKLQISPEVSNKKIYASGVVVDVTNQVKGAKAGLGVIALPREFVDKALGANVDGAVSWDVTNAQGKEFSFGYFCTMSDGSKVYYFHPRCKLVLGAENHDTSDDGERDPEQSYDIEIMPTAEGVWRVRYYTKDTTKPLTVEEFYKKLPYTVANIQALKPTESGIGG